MTTLERMAKAMFDEQIAWHVENGSKREHLGQWEDRARELEVRFMRAALLEVRSPDGLILRAGYADKPYDRPIEETWPDVIDAILAEK